MSDADELIRSSTYCSLVHVTQQLTTEVAPALNQAGLSPVIFLVLGQSLAAPGATPAELARRCGLTPQHLGEVLERCEQAGLVQREGERGRGRRTQVSVTADGVQSLTSALPMVQATGKDRLSQTQHRQIQALLDRLRNDPGDPDDLVVLVDEQGRDAGTASRLGVHTTDTPRHRAFSTHLRDAAGRVLLTRRALHKTTWPGVWTNAACGHLRPGETTEQAAMRRVPQELGVAPSGLAMALPDFAYRAVDASGIVENEFCPVMVGQVDPEGLQVDPDEVAEVAWVQWADLRTMARTMPALLSPWSVEQVLALGDDPWASAGVNR